MIKAHWLRLLLFALGGALLAYGASKLATPKYEGFVQILIDQKVQDPGGYSDLTSDSVRDITSFSRSRSIVTQVAQLTGFDVLRSAGLAAVENLGVPPEAQAEFAPINLQQALSVEAEQGSDIVTLHVRMSKPEYAQAVAGEIYNAFEAQNSDTTRVMAERATEYLKGKAADVKKQLDAIDIRMTDLRTKYNAPDLAAKIQSELNQLSLLKQSRDAAKIDYQGAIQRAAVLDDQLAKTPKTIEASTSDTPNPVVVDLETSLVRARAERAGLLEHNLPDSDRVKAVDSQIKQIQADLRDTKERLKGTTTTTPNPNYQNLVQSAAEAHAAVGSLSARVTEADATVAEAETRVNALPGAQSEMNNLLREQSVLEQLYQTFGKQLEALRQSQQGRIAATRLVTPASALPDPVSPKTLVNVIIGLIGGLLFGVLSMFGAEAKRQPVRSLSQLNSLSLVPVYRVIPELRAPFKGLDKAPHESYESLLVNVLRSGKKPYRVGVVGVTKNAGASTAALNLAIAAQRHGLNAVVISNDPKTSIKRYLWRSGAVPQGPVVQVSSKIEWIPEDDGKIMAAGEQGTKLSDAMGIAERDVTIFDFEPTTDSAEFALMSSRLDEIILLVHASKSRTVEFLSAQQSLKDSGCKLVTVVFTRSGALDTATDAVETEEGRQLAS